MLGVPPLPDDPVASVVVLHMRAAITPAPATPSAPAAQPRAGRTAAGAGLWWGPPPPAEPWMPPPVNADLPQH